MSEICQEVITLVIGKGSKYDANSYKVDELVAVLNEDHSEVSKSDGLSFVLDSGATKNILSAYLCGKYRIKIEKVGNQMKMGVANGANINIHGKCIIDFPVIAKKGTKKKYVKLTVFVSYDLPMKHSYLSLSALEDLGFYWANKHKELCGSGDYKGYKLPLSRVKGLYYTYFGNYKLRDHIAMLNSEYDPNNEIKKHGKTQEYWQRLYDIHKILGHCSAERIIRTLKNGDIRYDNKIDLNDFRKLSCTVCTDSSIELRKHVKGSLVNISNHMMPFEYVGIDLMIASKEGEFMKTSDCSALLVLVDFKTRYRICELLPDKRAETVANTVIDMIKLVETQFDAKVKVIVSDQGNEFKNGIFDNFLADHGKININPTLGDSRGNNMVENSILVIQKLTRKLMNENVMITADMWPYAARYGTLLSNYISGAGKHKVSAASMLGMEPIKVDEIYEFGMACMINQRSNYKDRNHLQGYYMGYENFRSYIPYFFVPARHEDENDQMVTSSSFKPLGSFKRGSKYMLELYKEFENDPLAQEFAYNVNKDQPYLYVEEAGLMNRADPHYEMKVLSANDWKKAHHVDETQVIHKENSTKDLESDEVEYSESNSKDMGSSDDESCIDDHAQDDIYEENESDSDDHGSKDLEVAPKEIDGYENTLPTDEISQDITIREPIIKHDKPGDRKVPEEDVGAKQEFEDAQQSVKQTDGETQEKVCLETKGEKTKTVVSKHESDLGIQPNDYTLSREPEIV